MKINQYIAGVGLRNRDRECLDDIAEKGIEEAVLGFCAYLDSVGDKTNLRIAECNHHETFGGIAGTYFILKNMQNAFREKHGRDGKGFRFARMLKEELKVYHKKIAGKKDSDAKELYTFFESHSRNLKDIIDWLERGGANNELRDCLTKNLIRMEAVLSRNYRARYLTKK